MLVPAPVFIASGYLPTRGLAGSRANSIFRVWGTAVLFSLYIPASSARGFQFLHSLPSTCSLGFGVLAIVMDVKCSRVLVLIPISLATGDVEWPFTCLLAICLSSLETRLFKSFVRFVTGLLSRCRSFVYILDMNPLSNIRATDVSSHPVRCPFTLSIVSFLQISL